MDDATNPQVSGQAGEADLPTPQFSDEGDSSPSADNVDVIVNKVVERLAPTLEQLTERKAKSLQDKRFSKIEKELGLRSNVLAELEEAGVEIPKDVRTEMRLRELEDRRPDQSTQPAPVRDNGLSQQKAAVTDAIAELTKNELDPNDAGFIELLRGKYASRAEFDLAVQRHIVSKLKPAKSANPADVVQSPARGGTPAKSVETLAADYKKEILDARGKGSRFGDAIKDKYRQLGVDVDNISFTV
jgi:hypothetical protein